MYSGMDKELTERKALVIAVQNFGLHPLWSTFADAYNVANMLENRFQYPPKCIRVLADLPTPMGKKDPQRWSNKPNIMEGLKWLAEGCTDGSKRFLYFAGHGYTSSPGEKASGREGVLPVQHEVTVMDSPDRNRKLKQHVDTETILFDWELINCIVDSLPDVKVKLTALFDCNYNDEISRHNPTTVITTHIRGHIEPGKVPSTRGQATEENYVPGLGNILGLPMKIDPGSTNPILPSEQAALNPENRELKPFPPGCEVVCWYSSVPIRDRQFTTTFTKGVDQLVQNGIFTYKDLYGYIREALDSRREQILPEGGGLGCTADEHQYPKLYVSENIAGFICDTEMDL